MTNPLLKFNNTSETDQVLETTRKTYLRPPVENVRKIVIEPVSAAVYNLDYACLLVPRFPQHHMTGDLLDRLGEWVPQICIAFAWRLEYISVRPDYLQWIVNVPPATSPAYLMRIFRQHTSGKIFAEFPRFKKRESFRRFLGTRLSHHGRLPAASGPVDQRFHCTDPPDDRESHRRTIVSYFCK